MGMMDAMLIRPMTPADAQEVSTLIGRSYDRVLVHYHSAAVITKFREHATAESLCEQLGRKEVYVVEERGRIIATGGLGWFDEEQKAGSDLRVTNLFVAVDRLGQGIGRVLLDHLIGLAHSRGASVLHVASSRSAVSFYERAGFGIDAVPPTAIPEITWMTKRLSSAARRAAEHGA
jgi:putative acetyltransferase